MEEELLGLVRQREAIELKLKRVTAAIKTTAAAPNPNLRNVHFLKMQLKNVEGCFSAFSGFQTQIYAMALTAEQRAHHQKSELELERLYESLTIQLNEHLERIAKPEPNAALIPAAPANVVVSQYLPPLNVPLPTFDGSCETWYTFKSMFQSVMARYTSEAPAIKLYHLRNSLVGKAAGVIDLDIVNNNDYDAAWAILEERYEDKREIIDRHIDAIFALAKISRDNAAELRILIDTCMKHIEALKALQLPVDGLGEQMLVNLLASRMDMDTRRSWESEQKVGVLPTYAATITFLKERCRVLERLEPYRESCEKPQRSVTLVVASGTKCALCSQQHELDNCVLFKGLSVNRRYSHLRKHGLCFSCLERGHRVDECPLTNPCQRCSKRHHTALHPKPTSTIPVWPKPKAEQRWRSVQKAADGAASKESALLSTAVVRVYGKDGVPHLCRTLIDSCSQNHFVSERFANELAVKKQPVNCEVSGLNGRSTSIRQSVRATIESRVSTFSREVELLITPRIIDNTPPGTIEVASWNLPMNVELADPAFHETGRVDMLLGASLFWDLLKTGKITLADGLPSLRETELGWVVGGAFQNRRTAMVPSFCGVSTR